MALEVEVGAWETGFNPIDVMVEDAVDSGDTVEMFTDFIDRLLMRPDAPTGAPPQLPGPARGALRVARMSVGAP